MWRATVRENQVLRLDMDSMRTRVHQLKRECSTMKKFLIDKLFSGFPENFVKKEIYARLCRPNSFDGGTKKAWLDKTTGGVCLSIAAKGLAITGIDDPVDLLLLPGLAFNRSGRHLGHGGG
ncbi:hypothetical protein L1049_014799 [Liquidambar formosana]|uniref:Uncharacterized protein n=1 Tax=Liquidambar formosana TaxID=63359 RepID=A0AAP0X5N6_LIQFO